MGIRTNCRIDDGFGRRRRFILMLRRGCPRALLYSSDDLRLCLLRNVRVILNRRDRLLGTGFRRAYRPLITIASDQRCAGQCNYSPTICGAYYSGVHELAHFLSARLLCPIHGMSVESDRARNSSVLIFGRYVSWLPGICTGIHNIDVNCRPTRLRPRVNPRPGLCRITLVTEVSKACSWCLRVKDVDRAAAFYHGNPSWGETCFWSSGQFLRNC